MEKLNVKALTLGLGVSWAACMIFLGLASMAGWGEEIVDVLSSLYIGFEPNILGTIIGAVWGFVDGAIGGAIIAVVYNAVSGKKSGQM